MPLLRLFSLFLFLMILVPSGVAAQIFSPKIYTLDNGLTLIVIEKADLPVVSHMVWYKVGARDDPPGQSGIAHYLEHMMFRGTKTVADGEFSQTVAKLGGQDNAFTSWDFTAYFQNIPKEALPQMMELEADRMQNLVLDPTLFDREKGVILEERAQRIDNSPLAGLAEEMYAAFYRNAPYKQSMIGWEHEIKALQHKDLERFYRRYYAPNNALVVVSGGISAENVKVLAEQTYGKVPYKVVVRPPLTTEPPRTAHTVLEYVHENVQQPVVMMWWQAPSYGQGQIDSGDRLNLLAELLGADGVGKLYRKFVIEKKTAVGVSVSYSPFRGGETEFSISATPAPGIKSENLAKDIKEYLLTFDIMRDVTPEDLEIAKSRVLAAAVYAQDSLQTGAYLMGQSFALDLPFSIIETWPERTRQISLENLGETYEAVFKNSEMNPSPLIGYLNPRVLTTGEKE